jgi:hypothetical protein
VAKLLTWGEAEKKSLKFQNIFFFSATNDGTRLNQTGECESLETTIFLGMRAGPIEYRQISHTVRKNEDQNRKKRRIVPKEAIRAWSGLIG